MTAKEQLLQELEQTPDELIEATLAFLRSVKAQHQETVEVQGSSPNPLLDLLAEFDQFATNMPPDEQARLPVDGAQQHDHYLYGTPKQA
ncbi:MAG: hypothetical protein NW224_04780 [Leptolyngbyaceae cyanobacterium bins.302]|nr:hypothetical protein [Leptolyngbyaceae cyanobacterium bins.302]